VSGSLTYVKGDATEPAGTGPKLIPHICNNIGGWGRGFVLALSARWREPEAAYRKWALNESFRLGMVQPVKVEKDLWVLNMLAQRGTRRSAQAPPAVCYDALRICLQKAAQFAKSKGASVHAPKFGAGLAGGDWRVIEQLIREELVDKGLGVTVYEFDG